MKGNSQNSSFEKVTQVLLATILNADQGQIVLEPVISIKPPSLVPNEPRPKLISDETHKNWSDSAAGGNGSEDEGEAVYILNPNGNNGVSDADKTNGAEVVDNGSGVIIEPVKVDAKANKIAIVVTDGESTNVDATASAVAEAL